MKFDEKVRGLVEFHGHLGPYLIVGMKMGELSNELLGKETGAGTGKLQKKAIVKTGTNPPISCIIDGIQYVSGCTLGKGNLEVIDLQKPEATFILNEKKLIITLKIQLDMKNHDLKKLAEDIINKSPQELFIISKNFEK